VLQYWEGLSDRQAADAVRSRIDWKYLLGLELTDAGFDFSILSEFRARLIAGQAEARLLDQVLAAFKARGLLKARGRQRTDSTRVIEAVRDLNRLELVGETLRAVLNTLAKREPTWLTRVAPAEWQLRYGRRFDALHLPKAQAERDQLALQIGQDGLHLLQQLAASDALAPYRTLACVILLRRIWCQQYAFDVQTEPATIRWRAGSELPPAQDLIVSPYDPEARYCVHHQTEWEGYKVHFTETCDEDAALHVLTHVETTPAPEQDVAAPDRIHAALKQRDLLPEEHVMDAGYVSANLLVEAPRDYGVQILGPITKDVSWQAREQTGYDLSQFVVEWEAQQVVCPHGQRSVKWQPATDLGGLEVIRVAFDRATCQACPAQAQCTRSQTQGRSMQLRPRLQHEAIQRTRAAQTTEEFTQRYNTRMGIEGTFSQAVRAFDARRSRYAGLAKTHLQMVATAVAINLERFADYLIGLRPVSTKKSAFAVLAT
jgi:transposase